MINDKRLIFMSQTIPTRKLVTKYKLILPDVEQQVLRVLKEIGIPIDDIDITVIATLKEDIKDVYTKEYVEQFINNGTRETI